MHSRLLVSGLPRSLPPLPPSPAPPCLPCVKGRQRAAPHSSSFPPTSPPLHTLYMDVWGPARVSGQGRGCYFLLVVDDYTRYTMVFPLRSKDEQNGIAERRIDLVMEVARTSMIHAVAPHFLWPFAVRYAAHQLNLWPRVSLSETSPTLHWTGKVGDASVFWLYHPTSRHVLPSQDVTFDGSVPFYRLFPYRSAPLPPQPLFLAPGTPPVDLLPPQGPAPSGVSQVDPLLGTVPFEVAVASGVARGAASEGAGSGGAEPAGAERGGAEPEGAEPGGAEYEVAESGGAEPRGTASSGGPVGASPRLSPRPEPLSPQHLREWFARRTRLWSGASGAGGSAAGGTGAGGAGATSLGGAGVPAGGGGPGGAGAAGPEGARSRGTGAAGPGGAGGAGAGDPGAGGAGARGSGAVDPCARDTGAAGAGGVGGTGAGGAGAGGAGAGDPGAGSARAGGGGAGDPGAGGAGAGDPGAGVAGAGGAASGGTSAGGTMQRRPFLVPRPPSFLPPPDSSQPQIQPDSPLPPPSPYAEQTDSFTERREPASRPTSPVCAVCTGRQVPRPRPPPVPGTHVMALRPSSVPMRVPLPPPPESSLTAIPDPMSDLACAVAYVMA
ncbi:unnamed protein product [Closterium sp. NIES-53]